MSDIVAPVQAVEGATVEVRYTVTNLGPGETPIEQWTDTIWLTQDKNRPHPGQGDYLLKSLSHSGNLVNKAGYDVVTSVRLPTGLDSGTYYITPWTDPYAVVLEDTVAINVNPDDPTEIDNNNYKARAIDVIALSIPDPDLTVEEVVVAPTGTGGEEYTVDWRVYNAGKGDAGGSWIDEIWLTDDPDGNINQSNSLLLASVPQSKLGDKERYDDSMTVTLTPSARGSHIVVLTDARRQVGESDEENNRLAAASEVTPRPADLEVVDIVVPVGAKSGEEATVQFTVQNTGDYPVWPGTGYWVDAVWISADVQFRADRASLFGTVVYANDEPLRPGESYTVELSGTLPEGIGGDFFVYVHTDTHNQYGHTVVTNWWPAEHGNNSQWVGHLGRWAYEDPFNNVASAPFPVEYFEPDLVISDLDVPAAATSGETVSIGLTVTNDGTRATRTRNWTDRVFLSRDASLDRFDTTVGEFTRGDEDFLGVGASYTATVDVRIPDGIDGSFYVLVLTDSPAGPNRGRPQSDIGFGNRGVDFEEPRRLPRFDRLFEAQRLLARGSVLEYQLEGNNTTSSTIDVTLATPPDLQVTEVVAPERVRAGQQFDVTYTVENFGGETPPGQTRWDDLIYLSRDAFLDLRADRYLGQIRHEGGLAAGGTYTNTESYLAPSSFDDETEEYYVFVVTDPERSRPRGSVFELFAESNNARSSTLPVVFELPPPTDLQVTGVTVPANAKSGEAISLSWTVTNASDSEPARGQWSDTLYLSGDATWDIGDVPLGRMSYSGTLQPGDDYTLTLDTLMPPATPGEYRVIARTDIFNQIYEREFDSNNALASAETLDVTVQPLQLGVPYDTTLSTGQSRLFQVTVPHDQTLRVSLSSEAEGSANEIFLRYDAAPTIASFDAAYEGGLDSDLRAVIPSTDPGVYYVLVRGYIQPADETPVSLLAELLPLVITDVNTDVGGDSKYVTTTIEGARFHEDAIVKLVRPGFAEFVPSVHEVLDSTKIIATFDFTGAPHGLYDVTVINPGDETAVVPYRFLVEQAIEPDVTIGVGGPRTILAGDVGTYSVALQSVSNLDTPYVHFEVGIPEMLTNQYVYGLPFVRYNSNVRGRPDGADDVPWAEIDSVINAGDLSGTVRSPGYLFDHDANGFTGFSFNVSTYPGLEELHDRAWEELVNIVYSAFPDLAEKGILDDGPEGLDQIHEGLTDLYNQLAAVPGECEIPFIPFRFHLVAAATAMTRDEFVEHALGEAETLRQAIIDHDSSVTPALTTLAADREDWGNLFLAALEEGGLLRDVDDVPPIREQERMVSLMATLSSGILIGPAGQEIATSGRLLEFFEQVREWYGHDASQMGEVEFYDPRTSRCQDGEIPVPAIAEFEDYDLGLSRQTHFEAFRVYVPWIAFEERGAGLPPDFQINGPQPVDGDEFAALDLSGYLEGDAAAGLASISGPQTLDTGGWLPLGQRLPYTVSFANSPEASRYVQEVRVVTQLDEDLDIYSFRLGDINVGKINVNIPSDRALFQGEFDFTASEGFILRVSAGIDQHSREATWLLQAIDPLTGELLQDPTRGLLTPNNARGDGNAFVSYTVLPDADAVTTGSEVSAEARVFFNNAPPEDTPAIAQPVDAVPPDSTLSVSKFDSASDNYLVRWSVSDDEGGSGFRHVTLYVATDGGDYRIWQRQLGEASGSLVFEGTAGSTYEFLALAADMAGNRETPGLGVNAQTDGTSVNLGAPETVPETTPPNFGNPPEPTPEPSTSPLFATAEQLIPAAEVASDRPEFDQILRPFVGRGFATGIEQSFAEIGPMAIVETPDGDVIVSGGASRSSLYRFGRDGGEALNPWVDLPYPVFNLAFDGQGRLWATSGGGPLLELDPDTGAILAEHGDGITMAMAIDPSSGLIYVASGAVWSGGVNGEYGGAGGVQVFDPETKTFTQFSRDLNLRVASLAVDPDGNLWATTWPDRGQVVRFTPQRRGELMLEFEAPVDSLAFGQPGTDLEGLLFVSQNSGANDHPGSELTMVDLATLRRVTVADGGTRGDVVVTTSDGRVLVSQSSQVDVLNPAVAPLVIATNPPLDGVAVLPMSTITVTFDQEMFSGPAGAANSVRNPENYTLVGDTVGEVAIGETIYVSDANTVHLLAGQLEPDDYALTVESDVSSLEQLRMAEDYVTTFSAVADFSALVDIEFERVRSHRGDDLVSWDVAVTNTNDFNLLLPVVLVLDPADGYPGVPRDAVGQAPDGRWFIELASSTLEPGDSTAGQTITFDSEGDRRVDVGVGVGANPGVNQPPVFDSQPVLAAAVGGPYEYDAEAHDPDGVSLAYFLASGPEGMQVDPLTGIVTWTPGPRASEITPVELHVYDTRGGRDEQRFEITVNEGNRPPTFADLPGLIEGREGEPIEFPLSLTDPDGDPLAVWMEGLPPGAVVDPVGRKFRWTPDFDAAGTYENVTFGATDGIHPISAQTTFAIAPGDQPPVLVLPESRIVREGDRIRLAVRGFDPDGGSVEFSSHLLPPGATLHPETGVFDWTPDFYQQSDVPYDVPITVFDGDTSVTETMSISVINANGAPEFDDLTGWRIFESQPMSFSAFAYDPDNPGHEPPIPNEDGSIRERTPESPASVTYSVEGLPPGANFDPVTTLFSWQPDFDQAGTYELTLTATDDGDGTGMPLSVESTVQVEVMNLNRTPEITAIDNQVVERDAVLEVPVTVTDPDGNPVELRAENAQPGFPLPEFVSFTDNGDGTGRFRFEPAAGDRGDYGVTLLARDDGDGGGPWAPLESNFTFIVTVESPNEPPRWNHVGDKVAVVGEPFELTLRASDADEEPLQFELEGLPAEATITSGPVHGTATLRWTPDAGDLGDHDVAAIVRDGGNGGAGAAASDRAEFRLVVRTDNVSPNLAAITTQSIDEGETLSLFADASDPDGDPLTYRGQNLPEGATVDPVTGEFRWTPSYQQAGDYNDVRIIVGDGHRSRFRDFGISVSNVNRPPVIVPREPLFMREGGRLEFTMEAGDPDGDFLTYAAANLPAGAAFTEDGRFTWTPGYEQAGDHVVTFTASDPAGLSDSTDVTLRIDNINRAPELATSFHAVRLGEELRFQIEASDPDLGTTLTYDADDLPEGATVDRSSGEVVWTPGPGQDGEYLVRVYASDGETTSSQIVVLLAAVELPQPDVSLVLTPSFPSPPGEPILVQAIADSLARVETVEVTLEGEPVVLDPEGRAEVSVDTPGRYELVATATDADGLVGTDRTTLKVRDPADVDAPEASLAVPPFGLVGDGVIEGTVADTNLDAWTLEMKRLGDAEFRTIARGHTPVDGGVLATLDVEDLPNDFYLLRLSARDISRRGARAETIVEVYTETKRNVIRTETDFAAELGGVPVEVTRQYDSVDRGEGGRLGNGWRLLNREVDWRASVPPTGYESQGLYSAYREGTRVYLRSPAGDELGFVFEPVAESIPGMTYHVGQWTPLAANPAGWSLDTPGLRLMRGGDQFFELSTGYPYNPRSPLFAGDDFELRAPDGSSYTVDAGLGITSKSTPSGETVYLGDSGIVAPGGEAIQLITDGAGRVVRLVGPGGEILRYRYDDAGNLVAVRSPHTGETARYGYQADEAGLLELAVGASGTGLAYEYFADASPVAHPVTADLGAAGTFTGLNQTGALDSGGAARFAFSVHQSELDSTSSGEVLLRIVAETAGGLQVAPPEISGLQPRSTHVGGNRSEAVYAIRHEGLYQFAITESGGTSGQFGVELMVAGDVNRDQTVDGLDSDLQASAIGRSLGEAGYIPAADLDGSGVIDIADRQLLFRNAGFTANRAPEADPAFLSRLTHVDLAVEFLLASAVVDPDGDEVFYRLVGAENGSVALSPDGRLVTFIPDAGFAGTASVDIEADDGFNRSAPVTLEINVSDAELLDIEIVTRQPRVGVGERAELLVLGEFADQEDVPLIGDYLTFTGSDGNVLEVEGRGGLLGLGEGYAAVTVRRGDHRDATAVTVGDPYDELDRDDGLFVYPGSLTLPLVSGQRQFLVQSLDGETDLSAAASGVIYVLGDSRVVDVTGDGLVTSASLGTTTLTIIHGPGEVTVPIRVVQPEIGAAEIGSEGGLLQSSEGTQLQIPPGALPDGVDVALDPLPIPDAVDLPQADQYTVGKAFRLDFSGHTLSEPAQLAVPVGSAGFEEGDTVYFMQRQALTDINGLRREFWLIVETGIVGSDGFARTTSPPYPGFSEGGQYIAAKSDQPEKLVTINGTPRAHEGFSLALDWSNGIGIHWGGGFLPLLPALQPVITIATYRRNPLSGPHAIPEVEQTVDVSAATPGQVFEPAVSLPIIDPADSAPVITAIELTSVDPPQVRLAGQRFAGATVIFRYRGQDYPAGTTSSDTTANVTVPDGIIAGLADVIITHPDHGESNVSRLTSAGGLGAVGKTGGGIAVFDTNTASNTVLKEYDFGGGSDTIFTTDLTRLYAATFRNGIGVVDTITLKQLPPIALPNNAFHHQITTDPGDRFLFVAGPSNTIYLVDIRPGSPTFHETIGSIVLPRTRPTSAGIAVSADGSKLLVGTGGRFEDGYLTVYELDWDHAPSLSDPSSEQFAVLLEDSEVPAAVQSVNATTDPDYATITYRYRVSSYTPWGGFGGVTPGLLEFGAITLSESGFSVDEVRTTIPGGLSPLAQGFPYAGYYTDILTPRDVVVAPDLSAAYVADWEFFLVFGYGGQRGDKVGVVLDPFGDSEYLGSTTPIDFGFVTSVALNSDGSRLFASYGGIGETLVIDTEALIRAGLEPESTLEDPVPLPKSHRERMPLDLEGTPSNPSVRPGVHITPITTGGLVQGLSTQQGDFFDLEDFGSGPQLDRVTLKYEVKTPLGIELEGPVKITLTAIPQEGEGDDVVVGEFEIDPDTIGSGGLIELVGEDPEDALKAGVHELVLDPNQLGSLAAALENEQYELLQAGADPSVAKFNRAYDFAGYYQKADGARGVLRTGSKTKDTVKIGTDDAIDWTTDGNIHPPESKSFVSATDILVVTADKKDWIRTLGDADEKTETDLVVLSGLDSDLIIGGRGDDRLDAGSDDGTEDFHFNVLVGMGGNDHLEGSETIDVMFGDGFKLGISDLESFAFDLKEGLLETPTAGLLPVGEGKDTLIGNDGFDVMFGGHGDDTLEPGKGSGSMLFGDTFEMSVGGEIDFGPLYKFSDFQTYYQELQAVGEQIDDFLSLAPEFAGDGADTIKGGGTFDVFFGGDGDDTVEMQSSTMTLGWGGKGADTIYGAAYASLIYGDELTPPDAPSQACEVCDDTIEAVPDSWGNFFIGGEGDDTITGGGAADFLIGDSLIVDMKNLSEWAEELKDGKLKPAATIFTKGDGDDTLDGGYSRATAVTVDFIAGGKGSDTITGAGFLVASGFKIEPSIQIDLKEMFKKKDENDSRSTKAEQDRASRKGKIFEYSVGFEYQSDESEQDTVTGVGPIDIIAGSKGNDDLFAKGYFAWIDGKDGDDTIDASEALGVWIEGGKGDDTITGASQLGSVIFGDEFTAAIPLNPADVLGAVSIGVEFDWQKGIKLGAEVSFLEMKEQGNDTIHTGPGFFNFVAGGEGEDDIYGEGYVNMVLGDAFNLALGGSVELDFQTREFKTEFTQPGLVGDFADRIYGSSNLIDIFIGGGGDDLIRADSLSGGGAADDIDFLFGNDGEDTIQGGAGVNVIVGGRDDDTLTGGDFANIIFGDTYFLAAGNPFTQIDQLKQGKLTTAIGLIPEGDGKDTIRGGEGLDFIVGGDGEDLITAGNGVNVVLGDALTLGAGVSIDLMELLDDPDKAATIFSPLSSSGSHPDIITGGDGVDVVFAGGGDDRVETYGGLLDIIFGNDGNDQIAAGDGFNIVVGGDGNDQIIGGNSGNLIWGDGFTAVDGEVMHQVPVGSSEIRDLKLVGKFGFIPAGSGVDTIAGGSGFDVIFGGESSDTIDAGDGFNFVLGDTFHISINRTIDLSSFADAIFSLANPWLYLSAELHLAGSGDDRIDGGSGTDIFMGGAGRDVMLAMGGDNYVFGNDDDDWISSGAGEDWLIGNDGADTLCGGGGEDVLFGRAGSDILNGGPETDVMRGGDGGDLFVFSDPSDEMGSIFSISAWFNDFDTAEGDFQDTTTACNAAPSPLHLAVATETAADDPTASPPAVGTPRASTGESAKGREGELTLGVLETIAEAAETRWLQFVPDPKPDLLGRTELVIANLPGTYLGTAVANGDGTFVITIDSDAVGYSWFIDPTPADDDEFLGTGGVLDAVEGSSAAGRVDLVTVVTHELGHVLGLPDLDPELDGESVMASLLGLGTRKVPTAADPVWDPTIGATAGDLPTLQGMHLDPPEKILDGEFDGTGGDVTYGWQTLGAAAIEGGVGMLEEDASFNSRLSQTVEIPSQATALRFTVEADFAGGDNQLPDAFEFALIDAHTGAPLIGTAEGLDQTDASVNVQAGGTAFFASEVGVPGSAGSGETLDLSQPHTFKVDLSGLNEDVVATLYFDLIGMGELGSHVRIDDVVLEGLEAPSLSVSLDPVSDSGLAGDGITRFDSIELVGTTDAGLPVELDTDDDGSYDVTTTAEPDGAFRFAGLDLSEGANPFRVRVRGPQGDATRSVVVELDLSPPSGGLAAPLSGEITGEDLGYVEVIWTDTGGAGLDPNTIDATDLVIRSDGSPVTVDRVDMLAAGHARYHYGDDGETLSHGLAEIEFAEGAVSDRAGNASGAASDSFSRDTAGPAAALFLPAPGAIVEDDYGYVEIDWTDAGLAGVDPLSFGIDDITIPNVTVDSFEDLGGGRVRYRYRDGDEVLAEGSVIVTADAGVVTDTVGNPSAAFQGDFTFAPGQDELQDVTTLVDLQLYGQQYNRRTSVFGFYAAITAGPSVDLAYPIQLVLRDLGPEGVAVLNAHGELPDGTPYFMFGEERSLPAGETTSPIVIGIQVPPGAVYDFEPQVLAVVTGGSGGGSGFGSGGGAPGTGSSAILLPSFQNAENRFDVNLDGKVTALDALNILNHLQRAGELVAQDLAEILGVAPSKLVDVNGDGNASALDALHVINELALARANYTLPAEGESKTLLDPVSVSRNRRVDDVYRSLEYSSTKEKVVTSSWQPRSLQQQSPSVTSDARELRDYDDAISEISLELTLYLSSE